MFAVKLLANSAIASIYYIILKMPSVFIFHISHITWGILLQYEYFQTIWILSLMK